MTATDAERDRPAPEYPVRFWSQVVAVPALAALVVAWIVTAESTDLVAGASSLSNGALVALGVGVVLVVGGEVWPFIGSRSTDPSGVAWSTTFAFAVLLYAGVVPAVLLLSLASLLSGLVSRKAAFRWVYNAGQYTLSLAAAWGVLALFGRSATLERLWAPQTAADLAVVLLAAAAYFVVNELVVTAAVSALTGTNVWADLRESMPFELAANGAQLSLSPLVAVTMQHAPALTVLGLIPVAAIHRSAAAERESRHAATHDDLTQLANRKHFVALSRQAIEASQRTGDPVAVLVIDLDRFKEVNDVMGHPAGDRVLVEVARRLRAVLRDGDVVARLGGDEFAVLVPAVRSPEEVRAVADRLRRDLDAPFHLEGHDVSLGASIGLAMVPEHGADFEAAFSHADTAMYAAKRDGTGIQVYSQDLDAGVAVRMGVLGALRRGIDAGELFVEYQPKVSMPGGELAGMEALVRWRTDGGTVVMPDEFIPLAEQSGLMPRLTAAVLESALGQCAAWGREGLRVPVAVNVSLRDVLDPAFAVGVASRLVRFGVLAPMLTLEITERVLAEDMGRVRTNLEQLSELGVRLSLDDFGTGWSSLVLLRQLPVTEVKLDRSFVSRAASSRSDASIVRAVTVLAHDLGLEVVAEGIEDTTAWQVLTDLGCDTAQGWHVSRPMQPAAATAWLSAHGTTAVRTGDAAS